jgi:hypothetical protein
MPRATHSKKGDPKLLLQQRAMQTVGNSPDAFARFIRQDIAIWKAVADQANAR